MLLQFKKNIWNLFCRYFELCPEDIKDNDTRIETLLGQSPEINSSRHVKMTQVFTNSEHLIDLEFLEESEKPVDIIILNSGGEKVYTLQSFTAPTLHIQICISKWDAELYTIMVCNPGVYFVKGYLCQQVIVHSA